MPKPTNALSVLEWEKYDCRDIPASMLGTAASNRKTKQRSDKNKKRDKIWDV